MYHPRLAVVGGGISGIVSAYLLSQKYKVSLFEKNAYLGGHTNTITIDRGADQGLRVDTGFIVFNNKNYPLFNQFLAQLGVQWRPSEMSFSYFEEETDYQYAGNGLSGLFSKRSNLWNLRHYQFLAEIIRFCRTSLITLARSDDLEKSLHDYLTEHRFHGDVVSRYLIPMGASIWSTSFDRMLDYPAISFLQFFKNHGLLSFYDRPRWRTVVGGSKTYVEKFLSGFSGQVIKNAQVESIKQQGDHVLLRVDGQEHKFDKVIVACHADQSLQLLASPTDLQQQLLNVWSYSKNRTYLHTDESFLPTNKATWASWNYLRLRPSQESQPVCISYLMNRLQGFETSTQYIVTLNPTRPIQEDLIIREIVYEHPQYDLAALSSQKRLDELNQTGPIYFCGSYFGYGFHEDAVRSAVTVSENLGAGFDGKL